jgi:hypothetical protein
MQQYGSCLAYGKYYWIIDKCPVQYHHGFVKEKCMYASQLDKLWDMPFYLKNSTLGQVTFKNMFCAFCHDPGSGGIFEFSICGSQLGLKLENIIVDSKHCVQAKFLILSFSDV